MTDSTIVRKQYVDEGENGQVWQGQVKASHRKIAIKTLKATYFLAVTERLAREATERGLVLKIVEGDAVVIGDQLGEGSFAPIFRATRKNFPTQVFAVNEINTIDEDCLKAFQNEASVLMKLDMIKGVPNLLGIHAAEGNPLRLYMPHVDVMILQDFRDQHTSLYGITKIIQEVLSSSSLRCPLTELSYGGS